MLSIFKVDVPVAITTDGLSEVLSSLLEESEKDSAQAPAFDYLIRGELLRVPLEEFLKTQGLTEVPALWSLFLHLAFPPANTLFSEGIHRRDRVL